MTGPYPRSKHFLVYTTWADTAYRALLISLYHIHLQGPRPGQYAHPVLPQLQCTRNRGEIVSKWTKISYSSDRSLVCHEFGAVDLVAFDKKWVRV
jgi:hypothetical protein